MLFSNRHIGYRNIFFVIILVKISFQSHIFDFNDTPDSAD